MAPKCNKGNTMKKLGGGGRWTMVIALLYLLAVASIVGVYRLGFEQGQIAALSGEVAK